MDTAMEYLVRSALVGGGATAVMDSWGIARKRLFGIAPPDYGLVGRWIAYLPRGKWRHERIASTPAVRGERIVGWASHYAIGIAFAALLLALFGLDWGQRPTLGPALLVGIGTVAVPFLVMQPGMGAGIAASRTPRPNAARLQSVVNHAVFGLGLYASAWTLNLLLSKG